MYTYTVDQDTHYYYWPHIIYYISTMLDASLTHALSILVAPPYDVCHTYTSHDIDGQ